MSDCGRPWGMDVINATCKGCWAAIFQHLISKPAEKILPGPEFCQDAAFIAYTLDSRLASKDALNAIGRKILSRDVQPQYESEDAVARVANTPVGGEEDSNEEKP